MSEKQKTKIIEEEITKRMGIGERGQYHQRHLMQDWVEASVLAPETLDSRDPEIISEHIERRARNMVVHPVNGTSIARTGICLQVINPDTSGGPRRDSRIAAIYPDFAPLAACGRQVYGHYECFFGRNGSGL